MIIYLASESGMPVGERKKREDFIHRMGPHGRLFSYYHIVNNSRFTSGTCFRYLIAKGEQSEPKERRKRLD